MVKNGQKWSKTVRNGKKKHQQKTVNTVNMIKNGQKRSKTVNRAKKINTVKNCQYSEKQ